MTRALLIGAALSIAVGGWLWAIWILLDAWFGPRPVSRTVLPAEEFDRLLAELDRPAQVNPAILAAFKRTRRFEHRD